MTLLGTDDRAYLSVGRSTRYALGDPTAPSLVLNTVDAAGCMWVADVPQGWAAPTVVVPMDRRPSGHGGFAGVPTYEPRTLTLEGMVTAPSPQALDAAEERWLEALLGSIPSMVRYTHLDEAVAKGLWVYPTGTPRWEALDDRVAQFGMVLVAEDPIKTGGAATYGPVRLPVASGEGGYPMGAAGAVAPWTAVGTANAVTVIFVPNVGTIASHAVYTVNGPVPRPRIALGTGEFVQLDDDLGVLDVWKVDTAAGSSTVNGVNRYDAWAAGSTFPLIPRGGTEVRLRSATGGVNPAAGLLVATAPSWK